jgi:hypothetical protein
MHNFNSGLFGVCSEYWDEKSRSFKKSNDVQMLDCCLRTCEPFVRSCVNECPRAAPVDRLACYKLCEDIRENCESNCKLSGDFWGLEKNPIYEGTKAYGCGDGIYIPFDKDCLLKHKEGIIKVCQNRCTPTDTVDCTSHCVYSYDLRINPSHNPLSFQTPDNVGMRSIKSYKSNSWYIIYAIAIVGVILFLYFIVWYFIVRYKMQKLENEF